MQTVSNNRFFCRNRVQLRAAFTLVEVIAAVLILAVLATGGMAFIYYSRTSLVQQVYKRAAVMAANDKMELLMRNQSWPLPLGFLVETNISLNGRTNSVPFTRTTIVSNGVDGCLDVTVRVQYAGPNAVVTLKTLRAK